jgi:hypothetical protein
VDVTCLVVVTVTVWEIVVVFFTVLVTANAPWDEADAEIEMALIRRIKPRSISGRTWALLNFKIINCL